MLHFASCPCKVNKGTLFNCLIPNVINIFGLWKVCQCIYLGWMIDHLINEYSGTGMWAKCSILLWFHFSVLSVIESFLVLLVYCSGYFSLVSCFLSASFIYVYCLFGKKESGSQIPIGMKLNFCLFNCGQKLILLSANSQHWWSIETFSCIVNSYGNSSDALKAFLMIDKRNSLGHFPCQFTYTGLLKGLCIGGHISEAQKKKINMAIQRGIPW